MADDDQAKPGNAQSGAQLSEAGKARRAREDARLAAALRANLARRKQQVRTRAAGDDEPAGSGS